MCNYKIILSYSTAIRFQSKSGQWQHCYVIFHSFLMSALRSSLRYLHLRVSFFKFIHLKERFTLIGINRSLLFNPPNSFQLIPKREITSIDSALRILEIIISQTENHLSRSFMNYNSIDYKRNLTKQSHIEGNPPRIHKRKTIAKIISSLKNKNS